MTDHDSYRAYQPGPGMFVDAHAFTLPKPVDIPAPLRTAPTAREHAGANICAAAAVAELGVALLLLVSGSFAAGAVFIALALMSLWFQHYILHVKWRKNIRAIAERANAEQAVIDNELVETNKGFTALLHEAQQTEKAKTPERPTGLTGADVYRQARLLASDAVIHTDGARSENSWRNIADGVGNWHPRNIQLMSTRPGITFSYMDRTRRLRGSLQDCGQNQLRMLARLYSAAPNALDRQKLHQGMMYLGPIVENLHRVDPSNRDSVSQTLAVLQASAEYIDEYLRALHADTDRSTRNRRTS